MTAPDSLLHLVAFFQVLAETPDCFSQATFLARVGGMHCHTVSKTFLIPALHMVHLQEMYSGLQHIAYVSGPS